MLRVQLVQRAARELPAPKGRRVRQVPLETKEPLARPGLLVQLALKVTQVRPVLKVKRGLLVPKAIRVQQVPRVSLGSPVIRDRKAQQAIKVHRVRPERLGRPVLTELLDPPGPKVTKARLVSKDRPGHRELPARLVQPVRPVPKETRVRLVQQAPLALKVRPGLPDRKEIKGRKARPERQV